MKNFILLIFVLSCSSNNIEKSKEQSKAELYYTEGTQNLVNKDYSTALDMLLKANELTPSDTRIHNNLGMTYYFKKQYDQAENHFKQSLRIDPKNSDARNNLASLYYQNGDYDKALEEYRNIVQDLVYQHQYRIHYNIALIYLKRNKTYEAQSELALALKEKSDYCPAHALLGKIERATKNYKKALKHFKEGTKGTCFGNPEMQYLKGIGLMDVGHYPEAKLVLKELDIKFKTSPYAKLAIEKIAEIEKIQISGDDSLSSLPSSQRAILDEIEEEEYESARF